MPCSSLITLLAKRGFLSFALSVMANESFAMSGVGNAIVSESDGMPCFSVEKDSESKDGLPLRGIVVKEARTPGGELFTPVVWSFSTANSSQPVHIRPDQCVVYGHPPPTSIQRTLMPLVPYRVYYVNIDARKDDSWITGYVARFCIKPAASGRMSVQVIDPDERGGRKRYEVCAEPTPRTDGHANR